MLCLPLKMRVLMTITGRHKTPRRAILLFCKECVSGNLNLCASPKCHFYPFKRQATLKDGIGVSLLKTIKAYCLHCVGYKSEEVKNCTGKDCPVFPFRLGRNPYLKGGSTDHLKQFRYGKDLNSTRQRNAF